MLIIILQSCLGKWFFKSKSLGVLHEGFMLPLIVVEELDDWPEKDVRQRAWVGIIISVLI